MKLTLIIVQSSFRANAEANQLLNHKLMHKKTYNRLFAKNPRRDKIKNKNVEKPHKGNSVLSWNEKRLQTIRNSFLVVTNSTRIDGT